MHPYGLLNRYNRVAVETADQKELILICYDEAIRSLQQGKDCYLKEQYAAKAEWFIRAQNLLNELLVSLNLEAGGQIAWNLKRLYQYIIDQITLADVKRNIQTISNLIDMLADLRSAWAAIDTRPSAGVAYEKNQVLPEAARGFAV
jgi:flagellar protein FliS